MSDSPEDGRRYSREHRHYHHETHHHHRDHNNEEGGRRGSNSSENEQQERHQHRRNSDQERRGSLNEHQQQQPHEHHQQHPHEHHPHPHNNNENTPEDRVEEEHHPGRHYHHYHHHERRGSHNVDQSRRSFEDRSRRSIQETTTHKNTQNKNNHEKEKTNSQGTTTTGTTTAAVQLPLRHPDDVNLNQNNPTVNLHLPIPPPPKNLAATPQLVPIEPVETDYPGHHHERWYFFWPGGKPPPEGAIPAPPPGTCLSTRLQQQEETIQRMDNNFTSTFPLNANNANNKAVSTKTDQQGQTAGSMLKLGGPPQGKSILEVGNENTQTSTPILNCDKSKSQKTMKYIEEDEEVQTERDIEDSYRKDLLAHARELDEESRRASNKFKKEIGSVTASSVTTAAGPRKSIIHKERSHTNNNKVQPDRRQRETTQVETTRVETTRVMEEEETESNATTVKPEEVYPRVKTKIRCTECGIGIYKTKVTTAGYIAAVLLFPCGTYACLRKKWCVMDSCTYCGHVPRD